MPDELRSRCMWRSSRKGFPSNVSHPPFRRAFCCRKSREDLNTENDGASLVGHASESADTFTVELPLPRTGTHSKNSAFPARPSPRATCPGRLVPALFEHWRTSRPTSSSAPDQYAVSPLHSAIKSVAKSRRISSGRIPGASAEKSTGILPRNCEKLKLTDLLSFVPENCKRPPGAGCGHRGLLQGELQCQPHAGTTTVASSGQCRNKWASIVACTDARPERRPDAGSRSPDDRRHRHPVSRPHGKRRPPGSGGHGGDPHGPLERPCGGAVRRGNNGGDGFVVARTLSSAAWTSPCS